MFRRFSINFALFSMVVDAALIWLALGAATWLRPRLGFLAFAAEYPELVPTPWLIYPVFALEWVGILMLFSLYDGRRHLHPANELGSLTLASLLAAVALAGTLYLTYRDVSRLLFIAFILMAYGGMVVWRGAARRIEARRTQRGEHLRRVLIVGAGPVGREMEKQIRENPQLGLAVAGFLDDNPLKSQNHPEIVGQISDVEEVTQQLRISDVVIALPQRAHRRIHQMVVELHRLPVKVWVIPDYFRLALHHAAVEEFAGIPMLDLRAPALNDGQRLIKRAFDLALTLALLPVALPLMGLIALAVRLDSPGPVLFKQQRVGENGAVFQMIKFRTMRPGAEQQHSSVGYHDEEGRYIHKVQNDPRVTRLGHWLRRSSLDELPQLFNVLMGNMSLVGPRPELPALVNKYSPWQRQRFAVPQGMTGWWQIHGRSNRPMHLNTDDDLYYIHHYSFWLDVYILMKTVRVVVFGKGAY